MYFGLSFHLSHRGQVDKMKFRGLNRTQKVWFASVGTLKRAVIEKCVRAKVLHFENK